MDSCRYYRPAECRHLMTIVIMQEQPIFHGLLKADSSFIQLSLLVEAFKIRLCCSQVLLSSISYALMLISLVEISARLTSICNSTILKLP